MGRIVVSCPMDSAAKQNLKKYVDQNCLKILWKNLENDETRGMLLVKRMRDYFLESHGEFSDILGKFENQEKTFGK